MRRVRRVKKVKMKSLIAIDVSDSSFKKEIVSSLNSVEKT
jgi:hypothetical protein